MSTNLYFSAFLNTAIEAALCLVEALIFGVIFYPVFRVVDNSANRLGIEAPTTPSTLSIVSDHLQSDSSSCQAGTSPYEN